MTRTPEDWDEYAVGLLSEWDLRMGEMHKHTSPGVGWHILQKAILNDYWMDNGRGPNENFKNLDAQRMNEFVAKIYYCWVQMWREKNPEMFEEENEGLVE